MSQIQEILIVGDGLASWMTASYLSKALNAENNMVQIKVMGIENAPDDYLEPATMPNFKNFCDYLGLVEMLWMEDCNASFSMGSYFNKWSGKELMDDSFWQMYGTFQSNSRGYLSLAQHWLHEWKAGLTNHHFAKSIYAGVYVCEMDKSPKRAFYKKKVAVPPYGYHFDLTSIEGFFKGYAINAGVEYIQDAFSNVALDESGAISDVSTKNNQKIIADLYIDCTGSHRYLMNSVGGTFKAFDTASTIDRVAVSKELYDDHEVIKPYHINTALDDGWLTELQCRDSIGKAFYFNAKNLKDEQAEEILLSSGKAMNKDIAFYPVQTGSLENHWVRNCIAIGSSAAYLEPIVPVNINLIQLGLNQLIYHFPDQHFYAHHVNTFNQEMRQHCVQMNDFLQLNYILTERKETDFWKSIKNNTQYSEKLLARIEEIKNIWSSDFYPKEVFQLSDYLSCFAGHFFLPEKSLPLLNFYQIDATYQRFQRIANHGKVICNFMESQNEYFEQLKRFKEYQEKKF